MTNKSSSEILYETYGRKMCLAPFLNSFYSTSGVVGPEQTVNNFVKPCSLIKGQGWDVENSSIKQSRNNHRWKTVRQAFLDGKLEQLSECEVCINAEKFGSSSPRQLNNDYLFDQLDLDIMAEMKKIVDSDLAVNNVYALDYMPSNYCNYACIMCYAGASSQRFVFDLKHGHKIKYEINSVDDDFFDIVQYVKIMGFTGGETILQPEVQRLIDHVIEKNLANDMIITILTNASDFSDSLIDKLKHFKKVLYTVSIDGLGDVLEYQRRGADWNTVKKNVLRIHQCPVVDEFINHVATSVNILTAMDFIDWCHGNDLKFIGISAVFQEHLGVAALPTELKNLALQRLRQGRQRYQHYETDQYTNQEINYVIAIDRLIDLVENTEFKQQALDQFIEHIKIENTASKKPLHAVVPEWAPWFVN